MKNLIRFSLACALAVASAFPAHAVEVAFERSSNVPLVYLNVAVKAGYTADPQDQAGIANFVGEMLLRGTQQRNKDLIDLELDQMGAKLEVEARGESVIMRGSVLSTQLDRFLNLMSELIVSSNFPEDEIRKLKSIMISGLLEEQGHDERLSSKRFRRFLFDGHSYGKPPLGTQKSIMAMTRDQMLAYYHRLYRDQMFLVVGTGDASEGKIKDWAQSLGKALPGGDPKAFAMSKPTMPKQRRLLIIDKPDRSQTQVYGGQIGVKMSSPDYFALDIANHIFGGGGSFSSRLMSDLRAKHGWTYGANSGFRLGTQPNSWNYYFFPASKDTPAAFARGLEMLKEFQSQGATLEEFAEARQTLINSAGFMFNTPKKRVENKLVERTLGLPDGFFRSYATEIEKVTLADVNAAIKNFFKPDQLTFTVLGVAKDLKEPLAKAAGIPLDEVVVKPYTEE